MISREAAIKDIPLQEKAKRNFIVFINPVSGTRNKLAVRNLTEATLKQNGYNYRVLPTEYSGKYDFLPGLISEEKITDIIICGGDGTINQIASHVINTKVNVSIIPMGSGNGLAFAAGIPKQPKKALDIILRGNASYIDAFMINNNFSCMLCGLGFDAQVAHEFAARSTRGLSAYIRETLKHFFKAGTYSFEIRTGSEVIKTDAFFISIANSNQFGNNFTIAPKASLSDGLLDIVLVGKTGKLNLLLKILQQVRSGKISDAYDEKKTVHYFHTKRLSISNLNHAPLHIDGEPAETAPHFDIKITEKAFRLLQP